LNWGHSYRTSSLAWHFIVCSAGVRQADTNTPSKHCKVQSIWRSRQIQHSISFCCCCVGFSGTQCCRFGGVQCIRATYKYADQHKQLNSKHPLLLERLHGTTEWRVLQGRVKTGSTEFVVEFCCVTEYTKEVAFKGTGRSGGTTKALKRGHTPKWSDHTNIMRSRFTIGSHMV